MHYLKHTAADAGVVMAENTSQPEVSETGNLGLGGLGALSGIASADVDVASLIVMPDRGT